MNGQDNMEQLLHYLPEYQVVLCKVHEYALQPDSIATHLSQRHAASSTVSKAIATKMLQQPLIPAKPDKLIMPKPGIRPIANLQIFEDGCACKICDYVCRSIQCMEKHLRKTHFWRKRRISRPGIGNAPWETNVWCQTFFPTARRFFRVSKDAQHQRQPLGEMPTRANSLRVQLQQIQQQKALVIQQQKNIVRQTSVRTEISPWLEKTEWIEHLLGQDLLKLAPLVSMPDSKTESMLVTICEKLDKLVEMARMSMLTKKVDSFDSQRINSFIRHKSNVRSLNIRLQDNTYKKYKLVWKQLLCYVIRTAVTRAEEAPQLYRLTEVQLHCLNTLISSASSIVDIPESDEEYEVASDKLDRDCLLFCISLLDHELRGSKYDSAAISFLAVLGIDSNAENFKSANNFTPSLSAFVKVAQMLVVQRSVMAAENGEIDYPSDMLEEMQARFMYFEGRTPMAWNLGLREHGKKIRTYTTNQGYIIWSDNAEVVGLKNFECSMTDFRKFVRTEVAVAQTELEALFLLHGHEAREDILPAMRLVDIKDNPAESGPDWYFIHDPRNGHLVDGSNWMLDRILDKAELQSRFFYKKKDLTWKEKEVHTYLKQVSSFMERLQLLMHVTSGQPPRGTELASIRYRNTVQGQHRNIFIENGLVTFVTQYHKGYSIDGTVK